jgi:hypothetical protein
VETEEKVESGDPCQGWRSNSGNKRKRHPSVAEGLIVASRSFDEVASVLNTVRICGETLVLVSLDCCLARPARHQIKQDNAR